MTFTALDGLARIKGKMETREAHIGIVGMGYVGLPLALLQRGALRSHRLRLHRARLFSRCSRNDQASGKQRSFSTMISILRE